MNIRYSGYHGAKFESTILWESQVNLRLFPAILLLSGAAAMPAQQSWTVKPEWVCAHENFLSSDVLAGRGSATRDEQITATYVASEFEGYGLKTAPGMDGYIQAAEVKTTQLDGHATLQVAGITLNESTDFDLAFSTGAPVEGDLVRVAAADLKSAKLERGSAVLVTGISDASGAYSAFSQLRRMGASIILIPQTAGLGDLFNMLGGKTRIPIRLAEDTTPPRGINLCCCMRTRRPGCHRPAAGKPA